MVNAIVKNVTYIALKSKILKAGILVLYGI